MTALKTMQDFDGVGPDEPYWSGLLEGKLLLPRCEGCARWHWPAVSRCGDCGSWDHRWHEVPLLGIVHTWAKTWHPYLDSESVSVPFVSVVVELPQAGSIRLLGMFDPSHSSPVIGTSVAGSTGATVVGGKSLPTIHWRNAP